MVKHIAQNRVNINVLNFTFLIILIIDRVQYVDNNISV